MHCYRLNYRLCKLVNLAPAWKSKVTKCCLHMNAKPLRSFKAIMKVIFYIHFITVVLLLKFWNAAFLFVMEYFSIEALQLLLKQRVWILLTITVDTQIPLLLSVYIYSELKLLLTFLLGFWINIHLFNHLEATFIKSVWINNKRNSSWNSQIASFTKTQTLSTMWHYIPTLNPHA